VRAEPTRAYAVRRSLDLNRSRIVRTLFTIRTVPSRLRGSGSAPDAPPGQPFLEAALTFGWTILEEEPGRELVLGSVTQPLGSGRPLRWSAGARVHRVCLARLHEDSLERRRTTGENWLAPREHGNPRRRDRSRVTAPISPLLVRFRAVHPSDPPHCPPSCSARSGAAEGFRLLVSPRRRALRPANPAIRGETSAARRTRPKSRQRVKS